MNWQKILIAVLSVYAELSTGGAQAEAEKILNVVASVAAASSATPPAAPAA